jgi:hypothetical protein
MEHAHHHHHTQSLSRTAWSATLHCLTGCAIGEVLGMVIGTALGWGNGATIALAVVLAFAFGYGLTMRPLLKAMPLRQAWTACCSGAASRHRLRSRPWRRSPSTAG